VCVCIGSSPCSRGLNNYLSDGPRFSTTVTRGVTAGWWWRWWWWWSTRIVRGWNRRGGGRVPTPGTIRVCGAHSERFMHRVSFVTSGNRPSSKSFVPITYAGPENHTVRPAGVLRLRRRRLCRIIFIIICFEHCPLSLLLLAANTYT